MMGKDYALVGVEFDGKLTLVQADCVQADKGKPEQVNATVPFTGGPVWLRCRIRLEDGRQERAADAWTILIQSERQEVHRHRPTVRRS